MRTLKAFQGRQYNRVLQLVNLDGTPAVNVFKVGSVPSCNVWEGQNQPAIFQPAVSWWTGTIDNPQTGYDQGQVLLSIAASQTLALDPAGEYLLLVDVTSGGLVAPGWEGRLAILATPGSTSPAPPDLASYDYCLSQLSVLNLTDTQIDLIPWLISAASQAIRLECNDRYFDLRTLTEWHEVYQDGYCRLWQYPIQIVTRVQGVPQLALTVSNNSTSVQTANAYFAYTGTVGGYNTNAQTATGIVLNWSSSGVASTQTLLFATYPTIAQMVTAINAVGSGWSAQAASPWAPWVCTELTGGFIGQGCTQNAVPSSGAQFNILTDLTNAKLRPNSPMLWVGRQIGGNPLAERWGPGGYELFGNQEQDLGLVRVTYVAGFPAIPSEVQYQTAQLVKWKLELGVQELLLKQEQGGDYEYELSLELVHNMPRTVREALGRWKLHYA